MPKLYIKTYGCQMNERDSEQVARMFVQKGYTMTDCEDEADVILFNSCSIREQAGTKGAGENGASGQAAAAPSACSVRHDGLHGPK